MKSHLLCLGLLAGALTARAESPREAALAEAETAWNEKRWLDCRNALTKYLAWEQLSVPAPTPEPPAPRVARRAPPAARPVIDPPRAEELLEKARQARRDGQLERALRFYRLAEGLPGGGAAREESAAVEKEMAGN